MRLGFKRHGLLRHWGKLAIILGCALLAGGAYWWLQEGRHRFIPRNFGVVVPGLIYRSGQLHEALLEDVLREHRIEIIIDLASDHRGTRDEQAEREIASRLGIRKITMETLNGSGVGDIREYADAIQAMVTARDTGTPLLIHCGAGTQRTGGVIACYRMFVEGWPGPSAYEEYVSYRSDPPESTNLDEYVNSHLEELARLLVEWGVVEHVPDPLPVFGPIDETARSGPDSQVSTSVISPEASSL